MLIKYKGRTISLIAQCGSCNCEAEVRRDDNGLYGWCVICKALCVLRLWY